jgi:predicted HD phosphohydrolase
MRLAYRVRQFGHYLNARLGPAEREAVAARLGPRLAELFARMTPAEQAHSYRVAQALITRGQIEDDLLIAALLHDVGKIRAPLQLWERAVVVLGRKLAPGLAERLGRADEANPWPGRAFVTAWQHAAWGAELAEQAGAPSRAAALIRRHQLAPPTPPRTEEDRLLAALRQADEEN